MVSPQGIGGSPTVVNGTSHSTDRGIDGSPTALNGTTHITGSIP